MSLQQKLLKKIQIEGRVSYGALCQLTLEEGYKIETMSRRLRELSEDKLIFPVLSRSKRNTQYISAYTTKTPQKPKTSEIRVVIIDGRPIAQII